MIISNQQVQNLLKVYGKQLQTDNQVRPKREVVAPSRVADEVSISGEGRLKMKAILAVRQAEDVRRDKVDNLKEAIASGTYEVSEGQVAESIILNAILDKLV